MNEQSRVRKKLSVGWEGRKKKKMKALISSVPRCLRKRCCWHLWQRDCPPAFYSARQWQAFHNSMARGENDFRPRPARQNKSRQTAQNKINRKTWVRKKKHQTPASFKEHRSTSSSMWRGLLFFFFIICLFLQFFFVAHKNIFSVGFTNFADSSHRWPKTLFEPCCKSV